MLHVTLTDEITQGFNMMKYSANHPWKFDNYFEAYFVGLAQALVVLSVETVNLAVLNTNHTIMDILMNFLALVIISDFDDYFFITIKNDKMAKLVSDGELEIPEDGIEGENKIELSEILKVSVTTSNKAKHHIDGNKTDGFKEEDDEGKHVRQFFDREPDYIYFDWNMRDRSNKCARLTYKLFKAFFASVWFYFIPFACLYLSFAIPFKFTDSEASKHVIDPITIDTVEDETLNTGYDWDSHVPAEPTS